MVAHKDKTYDKAREAMPKVGYYQFAWSGLMVTPNGPPQHNTSKIKGDHQITKIEYTKKCVC